MDTSDQFAQLFNSSNGFMKDGRWDDAIASLKKCLGLPKLPTENRMMVHYNLGYALTKGATSADEARKLMTPEEMHEAAANYKVVGNIYNKFLTDPQSKNKFKGFRDNAKAAVTFFVFQLGVEIKPSSNRWEVNFKVFRGYPTEYV
jgi:hypothetical protein